MKKFQTIQLSLFLACLLATTLHAALPFLFWLPSPKRINANDPKSDLFKTPSVAVPPVPTGTFTFSPTLTATRTASPTPTFTDTAAGTFTDSPTATLSNTPPPSATDTPTFTNTPSPTATPTTCVLGPTGTKWDDFEETGSAWAPYSTDFCGPHLWDGCTDTPTWVDADDTGGLDLTQFHSGTKSWSIQVQSGSEATSLCGWGHPFFGLFPSTLMAAPGPLDFSCATNWVFWIKTDKALTFKLEIDEGSTAPSDSERWASAPMTVNASASWQLVSVPLSTFTCASPTNGVLDKNDFVDIVWQITANIPVAAQVYIDDVEFQ